MTPQADTEGYNELVTLFQTGANLELDYFGLEAVDAGVRAILGNNGAEDPGLFIMKAFEDGFGDQILLSQDVCFHTCYHSNNPPGLGYDALQSRYLDEMRAVGVTEEQIYQMTVVNPQRLFTIVPEPGTLSLLIMASLGLVAFGFRRHKRSK